MKLLPPSILIFLAFFSFRLAAQELNPESARSDALAGSSAALTGCFSIFGNQAGLASITRPEVGGSFQNRFLIQELSGRSVFFVLPVQSSVFAISLFQIGILPVRHEQFGISYARNFTPRLSFGTRFNYYRLYFPEENATSGTAGIEFGFQYAVNKQLLFGIHVRNPYPVTISTYAGKYDYPSEINLGFYFRLTDLFSLLSDLGYNADQQVVLRTGMEYQPAEHFFIRAGISGNPVQFSGGIGFQIQKIKFDLASSYHNLLGNSPTFSFYYQF